MLQMLYIVLNIVRILWILSLLDLVYFLWNELMGCRKNISDVYTNAKFTVDEVTELNFIQGELGNCGMIASMASLARNRELLEKIAPVNQCFNGKQSEFVFNLYKRGKPQRVVVNERLFLRNNSCLHFIFGLQKLYYSQSHNHNFIGPLLEKALVKLHFDEKYELSYGVMVSNVLSSLSNNFFEEFSKDGLSSLGYNLESVITHGRKYSCLMVVSFNNNNFSLHPHHAYTIIDCKKDVVNLYNPHGKHVLVPINYFIENLNHLCISYTGDKVFEMANVKTLKEFSDCWEELSADKTFSCVYYLLTVEEDGTEVLINIIDSYHTDVHKNIFLYSVNAKTFQAKYCDVNTSNGRTLRKKLMSGSYQIEFMQYFAKDAHMKNVKENYSDCSKIDKNGFCFRFAASKKCTVKKIYSREDLTIEDMNLNIR